MLMLYRAQGRPLGGRREVVEQPRRFQQLNPQRSDQNKILQERFDINGKDHYE